ncbi:MAG: methyltransferase domain-containing protein [Kordiimonadaceae bacterium]|nr:methyltransferase domain-containing protein [Kordiimonadaceae bacterium]
MSTNPAFIFDTTSMLRNKARGRRMGTDGDFLRQEIADRLQDRLLDINRTFTAPLDIGSDYGRLSGWQNSGASIPISDAPIAAKPDSHDLIVSNLNMHWVNDLPGLLVQINRTLKPDGMFIGSMLGGNTLTELRHSLLAAEAEITGGAHARIIPFAEVKDMGSLLQRAGFTLPVADTDTLTATYEHPLKLMRELRAMGEANAHIDRPKTTLRRDVLMRACEIYQRDYSNPDGRIRATFQVLYMVGWHPHKSQQKPLKPGSATMRLEAALKATAPAKNDR